MSDNAKTISKDLEYSLKYQISRQVGMKEDAYASNLYLQKNLIQSWKTMMPLIEREVLSNMIWTFVENSPFEISIPIESRYLNIYSTIKEYENKKGKKHLAHFSCYDNYLGDVKKLGSIPISFTLIVDIKHHKGLIELDFSKLEQNPTPERVKGLFKVVVPTPAPAPVPAPITPPTTDDDDDVPLINLIKTKNKTTKTKKPKKLVVVE